MGWLKKYQDGGVIEDNRGQWAHPGKITKINSNDITMKGVNYPVLGVSDTGDTKMMQPGQDYKFEGDSVTEFPITAQNGKTVELDAVHLKGRQSPEWRAYKDSLNLYNKGINDIKTGKGYSFLDNYIGKPREEYPFPLKSSSRKLDSIQIAKNRTTVDFSDPAYKKHKKGLLTKEEVEEEAKFLGKRDFKYQQKGLAKKRAEAYDAGEIYNDGEGLHIYENDYNIEDWTKPLVPVSDKIQPTSILYGAEAEPVPLYKKPTKPKERKINMLESKGLKSMKVDMPEYETVSEDKPPYLLSGDKKNVQQRTHHRRTHLRPNGSPYTEGYHPVESLPKIKLKRAKSGLLQKSNKSTNFTEPTGWLKKYAK